MIRLSTYCLDASLKRRDRVMGYLLCTKVPEIRVLEDREEAYRLMGEERPLCDCGKKLLRSLMIEER